MKTLMHRVLFVLFAAQLLIAARGANGEVAISCEIAGVTNIFWMQPRAVYTPQDGLQIFAFRDPRGKASSLSLTIPSPRVGRFSLRSDTNITLFFSRSVHSSSSADHYDARTDVPGTAIDVTIEKLGGIGEHVEGRFFGIVANASGQLLSITNGVFSIVRSASIVDREGAQSTNHLHSKEAP